MMNKKDEAEGYTQKARELAEAWKNDAFDGNFYRLAFGQKNSWSIKYNLVWDKLFGMNIFDEDIFKKEVAYYKTKINRARLTKIFD